MPQVKVEHSVKVGGKTFKLRTVKPFMTHLVKAEITATIPQLRNLAYESRDLLYEKLLAGTTEGYPPVLRRTNFPKSKAKGPKGRRTPFPFDRTQPLDEEYLERKVSEGHDPRKIMATGTYLNAIQVVEGRKKTGPYWYVRLQRGTHRPSGLPYKVLWRLLEYGSAARNVKPRPHWGPTFQLVRKKFARLRPDIRAQALRDAIRSIR